MFEIQRGYVRVVQERGFRLPDRYLDFEPQVRALEAAMRRRAEPTVPCNNDLLAENFIDTGDELRLIDYEYSGNNEPSFELGNSWSESNLQPAQLEELVSCYYGLPLRNKVARARLWGVIAKYGWMLWASIQEGVSTIEFDYWSWGLEKYERGLAQEFTVAALPGGCMGDFGQRQLRFGALQLLGQFDVRYGARREFS